MNKSPADQSIFKTLTTKLIEPGSETWWNSVIAASNNFCNPHREQGAFAAEWLCQTDIKMIVHHLLQEPGAEKSMRLYVGGGLRPDALGRLLTRAPFENETMEEWGTQMMHGEEYGLVINNAEQFHPELSQRLARFFAVPLKKMGLPPGGIEVGCFLGNYSQSPFGVHHDRDQSVVFHFQIGPGDKTMWCWSHDDYLQYHGNAESCFEWDHLKHCANETRFGTGDFYVLPCEGYHIGQSAGFSMGLAVAFVDLTQQQQFEKALATFGKRFVNDFSRLPQPNQISLGANGLPSSRLRRATDKGGLPQPLSFEELLDEADLENNCRQWSNLGFHHHCDSVLGKQSALADIDAVRVVDPFPLVCRQAVEGGLKLYARGHCFHLPEHPRLIDAIQKINDSDRISMHELAVLLTPFWSSESVLQLVRVLIQHQALEVVNPMQSGNK